MSAVQVALIFPTLGDAAAALAKIADSRVAVSIATAGPVASDEPVKPAAEPKPGKSPAATPSPEKPSAPAVGKPSNAQKPPAVSAPPADEKPADEPAPDLAAEVSKAIVSHIATPEGKAKTAKVLGTFTGADGKPVAAGRMLKPEDRAAFLAALAEAFGEAVTADDMS